MSAKPKLDTRLIREYEEEPLPKIKRNQLHKLGWTIEDIVEMTVSEAYTKIKHQRAKPGSDAFIQQETARLAAGGLPAPAGIDRHSNEAIEERNASRPEPSNVAVQIDEFQNQCLQASTEEFVMNPYSGQVVKGSDPLNSLLLEMEEKFCVYKDGFDKEGRPVKIRVPTRRFRWSHPNEPREVGPMPEPVYGKDGKQVQNGELFLEWIPTDVWKEGRQEPQLARSRAMTGAIEGRKNDLMNSRDEQGPLNEGSLQMGRSEENYAA